MIGQMPSLTELWVPNITKATLTAPVRPFATLVSATVYSTQGDSVAQAILNGLPDSQVTQLKFQSPSGTVNAADGPLAVFLYRLDPSAQPGDIYDLTMEFQDVSWHVDEVFALLAGIGAALCATEQPDDPEPPIIRRTGPFLYLRLRRNDYTATEIDAWAAR